MISNEVKSIMRRIFNEGVKRVSGRRLVREELKIFEEGGRSRLRVRRREYELNNNCYIVGFGKAVLEMGLEAESILGSHLRRGILSVPFGSVPDGLKTGLDILEGAKNNIPDENSVNATLRIVELVESLGKGDLLLALISGGGSALLSLPANGITLEEKTKTIKLLSLAGADITQLNAIRTLLSGVKGGRLLNKAHPASVVALILSDIVGDPLHFIASGPLVPAGSLPSVHPTDILRQYSLVPKIPESVSKLLANPLGAGSNSTDVQNIIIGNNALALSSAEGAAIGLGYECLVMSSSVQGLVGEIAVAYSSLASLICRALSSEVDKEQFKAQCRTYINNYSNLSFINGESCTSLIKILYSGSLNSVGRKICLLFGGEPTVQVSGAGLGGRNQELALRFSVEIAKHKSTVNGYDVAFLSGGTDGIDGPTDAAGALAYTGQLVMARNQKLDYDHFLSHNDSYTYYSRLNGGIDHIKTGHTFTNVMDIHILTIQSSEQG